MVRDSEKQQQVRSQCPAASNCSMCPRGRHRARARRETKKGSAGVAARRHPTRRHPKHFAEPSGGRRWTLRAHDPDIWLYLACAEEHRSRCGRSPITGHTTPSSHGSAARPPPRRRCNPMTRLHAVRWRGEALPPGDIWPAPRKTEQHIRRLLVAERIDLQSHDWRLARTQIDPRNRSTGGAIVRACVRVSSSISLVPIPAMDMTTRVVIFWGVWTRGWRNGYYRREKRLP